MFSFVAVASILITASRIKAFLTEAKLFEKTTFLTLPLNFRTLSYFVALPVILTSSILFTFFGVRVQVFSWLMLSIILFILFDSKNWNRRRLLLPLVFLLWANIHGSFVMGIGTFTLFLILRSVRSRKVDVTDYLLLLISGFVTLLNPYGVGVWREAYSSASDSSLRWKIIEWMPSLIMFDLSMVTLIGLSVGLVFKYRNKFSLEEKGVFLIFLLQAIASRRHLPLWAIVTLPIATKGIYFVWLEAKKVKEGVIRFTKVYEVGWAFISILVLIQATLSIREAYFLGKGRFYPKEAVAYLSQNIPKGEIFSEYGWGGYLIWKLPQKKVFIDGRMPSWRYIAQNPNELSSAFDTYEDIQGGKVDYKKVFTQFNTITVLWSKPRDVSPVDNLFKSLEVYLKVFGWEPTEFHFLETLESDGWRLVYEDETAVIYQR